MNTERHWKATAGGVMSIIAGTLHLLGWLAVAIILNRLIRSGHLGGFESIIPAMTVWNLVLPLLILAVIAIIGGIFAVKKKYWKLALTGAICAICSPASWILGVTATVLISISKYEFNYSNSKSSGDSKSID